MPQEEMKQRDDLAVVDAQVKELGKNATEWRTSTDYSTRCDVLLKKKKKMEKQINIREVVLKGDVTTPAKIHEFIILEKIFSRKQRDTAKKKVEGDAIQDMIGVLKNESKWDKTSVHSKISAFGIKGC